MKFGANPFDSQQANFIKNDLDILAITHQVQVYLNDDIKRFQTGLKNGHQNIMDHSYLKKHVKGNLS